MKRILVLDDEKKIRELYVKLLTSEGFEVIEASNAVAANEILKTVNIDLILLDIKMPKVSGSVMYDVIEQCHKHVKVIVSSVYPLYLQKRIIPGATDYYEKSDGIDMLLVKIKTVLNLMDS